MRHEVKNPTYEIVGPLQRFDERDNLFAREWLVPGSPEATKYYLQHPELEELDLFLRQFVRRKYEQKKERDPLHGDAFFQALFGPVAPLALPDVVDGPVSPTKAEVDPVRMAKRIKALVRRLGADLVRIGPLKQEWVYTHRGCPPFFKGRQPNPPFFTGVPDGYQGVGWGDPIEISHRFAVTMGFQQDYHLISTGLTSAAELEMGRVYALSALVAVQLASYIRALGYPARAHHVRNYGVMVVPVGADAGLGEVGRCGYLVTEELGANLRLSTVTTDLPMALDRPVDLGIQDFCEKCKKCAVNCPAGAIPEGEKVVIRGVRKWKIDERKCLALWVKRGSACGICQVVCPWSMRRSAARKVFVETAVHIRPSRRLLVGLDSLINGAKFKASPPPRWMEES